MHRQDTFNFPFKYQPEPNAHTLQPPFCYYKAGNLLGIIQWNKMFLASSLKLLCSVAVHCCIAAVFSNKGSCISVIDKISVM